jgi:SAM-dependent methyltransferase
VGQQSKSMKPRGATGGIGVASPPSFAELADEYYDSTRHLTCANFREASAQLLAAWLSERNLEESWTCEVGAGKSLLAEVASRSSIPVGQMVILDSSPEMLSHSRRWEPLGARRLVADANHLPLASGIFGFLISIMGDAYNTKRFWREAERVLHAGGEILFTTPSYLWAKRYRSRANEPLEVATFDLADGRQLQFPSLVRPVADQIRLIEEVGLRLKGISELKLAMLEESPRSPKLTSALEPVDPVATGYIVSKP